MTKISVPGTFRLEHIRGVVDASSKGANTSASVASSTGISSRHVSFAIRSALLLDWLSGDQKSWQVTGEGEELLTTTPGSVEEANCFHRAIAGSAVIKQLSPELLKPKTPSISKLTKRIVKTSKLSEASANRGARVLLSWRRQALGEGGAAEHPKSAVETAPPLSSEPKIRLASISIQGLGPFKDVHADLKPLTLLVGGTASGKSTLVDSLSLVSEALHIGLPRALERRGNDLGELLHNGKGDAFRLAFELWLPEAIRPAPSLARARYELVIGALSQSTVGVRWEALFYKPDTSRAKTLQTPVDEVPRSWKQIIVRESDDAVRYHAEQDDWVLTYVLDGSRLGLAAVPEDNARFPVTLALRQYLRRGATRLSFHPSSMKKPCTPLSAPFLERDGSNIAAIVHRLRTKAPQDFEGWLDTVRKALPQVKNIRVVERPEDRHLVLMLERGSSMALPGHRLSDGTLRLLALTLLPYGGNPRSLVLADEPAPGLPPAAIAAVYGRWAATSEGGWGEGKGPQIVVSTHSPLWARRAKPEQILCLERNKKGESLIIPGSKHTRLKKWRSKFKNGTLFESYPLG